MILGIGVNATSEREGQNKMTKGEYLAVTEPTF